jgi:hypothetical protein
MTTDHSAPLVQPREWDAASYDTLPLPHEQWGQRLLATLPLAGDETVLDVGAGTGRDTAALLDRLPRGAWCGGGRLRGWLAGVEDYVRLQACARRSG